MAVTRITAPQTTPTPTPSRPSSAARKPVKPASRMVDSAPALRLQPSASGGAGKLSPQVAALVASPGAGEPLPSGVRRTLERSFDYDLTDVRVHSDARSSAAVDSIGARAFAYGMHIFLGTNEYPTNLALMAHEVTHVVQQQGMPVFQMYTESSMSVGDRFESEAAQASSTAQSGGRTQVQQRTGEKRVQGEGLLDQLSPGFIENRVWGLLESNAPDLVPILKKGVGEWLKERIGNAIQAMMDDMARPIKTIGDLVTVMRGHFINMVTWMREAGAKFLRNDCSPITEAADKVHQVFDSLASPVVKRVQDFVERVKGFFSSLWDRFGAPVWDFLKRFGGAIWDKIQSIGRMIWEKTQPIRNKIEAAWKWFKNWLGIGEGEEGQNGVLQWFQRKASEAWAAISEKLAPYKRQLLILVGVLALLSPAGPVILIVSGAAGILRGVQWIRQKLRNRQSVVQEHGILRGVLLPAVLGALDRVSGLVGSFATTIVGALTRIVGALESMVAAVNGIPLLSFASGLINFFVDAFRGLLNWAIEGVQGLATWVQSGLRNLGGFARRVVNFLERIAKVIANVARIGYELGSTIWNLVPACLRDPFIDFFIPLILKQIPFFSEIASSPESWQKTRSQITALIRQIFKDFDLVAAMKTAFLLVVRVMRISIDLVMKIVETAAQAWDLVIAAPLRFIENSLKAILKGFGFFMKNFLSHLWYGVQGWLLNAIQKSGTNIKPPESWDFKGVFAFVISVLGISIDHVFELLEKRTSKETVRKIKAGIKFLTGAWEWIKTALDKGVEGLWEKLTGMLSDLAQSVLGEAVKWVLGRIFVIVSARITALAASAGLSSVLEAVVAVYAALRTAQEYMEKILQIILTVFTTIVQIAQGVLDPAAKKVEEGLHLAMPVVIGFLANYAGLTGIGSAIRDIVLGIREKVDNAILKLIDIALAAGGWLLNMVKIGVQAVLKWWTIKKKVGEGEEKHTLEFMGDEDNAELYLESTPTRLISALNQMTTDPKFQSTKKQNALSECAPLVKEFTKIHASLQVAKKKKQDDVVESKAKEITQVFDKISAKLDIVFSDDKSYGEEKNPIPLTWYGPPISEYPDLYFGGPLTPNQRPKSQKALKALYTKGQLDANGVEVEIFSPTSRKKLPKGSDKIGVTSKLTLGKTVIGPLSRETTNGGKKLKDLIEPYGFSGENEGLDLDHIYEIQFGGLDQNDTVENLWPLDKSINRSKGSRLSKAPVEFPKGTMTTIDILKVNTTRKFWFRIDNFG